MDIVAPLNTNPFSMVKLAMTLWLIFTPSVTPSNVNPPVCVKNEPLEVVIVPPVILPPDARFHPLVSVNIDPVLFSVPVTFTVPPVLVIVPKPDVLNVPPMFSVPLLTLIVPLLLQEPPKANVPPLTLIAPLLLKLAVD
jgi:hypothetical protein